MSTESAEIMTAQRRPGRDSERVPFELFAVAFLLDMLLHIAIGVAVGVYIRQSADLPISPLVAGIAAGVAASFVHRTLVQRFTRTTAGKAVFGLQLRQQDGSYPSLGQLVKQWVIGVLATIGTPMRLLN